MQLDALLTWAIISFLAYIVAPKEWTAFSVMSAILCVAFLLFTKGIGWENNFTLHIMHLIWRKLENYLVTDFSDQACKMAYIMLMAGIWKWIWILNVVSLGFDMNKGIVGIQFKNRFLVNSFITVVHNHASY